MNKQSSYAKRAVYIFLVLLFFLHQDFWFWDDGSLVMGFIPVGLVYHIGYSVIAAIGWCLVIKHAWPSQLEATSEQVENPASASTEVR